MTQDKWSQLRQRLLKTVGQNNYTTWIEPLEFDELEGGVAIFHVPTNFMGNYVSQNFHSRTALEHIIHRNRNNDAENEDINENDLDSGKIKDKQLEHVVM